MQVTLGGNRLGSGKKMQVNLKEYERSTHDLSYLWRSTASAGTLIPFLHEVALPGDTFDLDLDCDVKTHPTVGPLFGSAKVQLDVFVTPIRLYQAQLHNNKLNIGLNMSAIKLPQVVLQSRKISTSATGSETIDNYQINPSCIFSYLGIRGLGKNEDTSTSDFVFRSFWAVDWLNYWDIYKNYYANKQEENGAVIHTPVSPVNQTIVTVNFLDEQGGSTVLPQGKSQVTLNIPNSSMTFTYSGTPPAHDQIVVWINQQPGFEFAYKLTDVYTSITTNTGNSTITASIPGNWPADEYSLFGWDYSNTGSPIETIPQITMFPLENIDTMRENILAEIKNTSAFTLKRGQANTIPPFSLALNAAITGGTEIETSMSYSQEGLALKTYQSDLFNNYLRSEWIAGSADSITELTSVDTSSGKFSMDTLNIAQKVYDMLNRIATGDGSFRAWIETVYTHEVNYGVESPMYMGGLIKELAFQEVVSNAAASAQGTQPLGTLAGKGVMTNKHKGGKISIKIHEPSVIMGIFSITPRVDYSQGNKWTVNLKTMDDFHKPAMDEIGFQDLITDQMAWWDTKNNDTGDVQTFQSAGKQPAWVNYTTNVNVCRGNFADSNNEMFMTFNRRFEYTPDATLTIKDLTTYIDPVKFNYIFAQTSRDAQNYWAQIQVNMIARRKMSYRIMPNL